MSPKKKSSKGRRPPAAAAKRPAAAKVGPKGAAGPSAGGAPARARKERTGPTRAERLAAAAAARRRRRLRNRALLAGALAAVLIAITVVVVNDRRAAERTERALEAGGCELDGSTDSDSGAAGGRNHVPPPSYRVNPPAGGNHAPTPAAARVYTATAIPPDGEIVHAMEHGYVVLWHAPDLPSAQVEELRAVVDKYPRDVLMAPRGGMSTPIAATAWHRRLLCGAPVLTALDRFVTEFRNQGPEKVPR